MFNGKNAGSFVSKCTGVIIIIIIIIINIIIVIVIVTGGFLLHQMSLEMDLDFFVLFSSMASLFGSIGQASYCAANAFLDSLAQYRRHVLGLPGLAINWGPIGGAGVMERDIRVAKIVTYAGLNLLNSKEGEHYLSLKMFHCFYYL